MLLHPQRVTRDNVGKSMTILSKMDPHVLMCFQYRLEAQGYTPLRVPLLQMSQKIPLPAE